MSSSTAAYEFVAAVLQSKDPKEWFTRPQAAAMFLTETEQSVRDFVDSYVSKNGDLPSVGIVKQETGITIPSIEGHPEYHFDRMRARWIEHALRESSEKASKFLVKGESYDAEAALNVLRDAVVELDISQQSRHVGSLKTSLESRYQEWLSEVKGTSGPLYKLGWPTLDNQMGGLRAGDVVSIVGRPSTGKTWFTLYMANSIWKSGATPVFFTLEMGMDEILGREMAMQAGVPYDPIFKGQMMLPAHKTKVLDAIKEIKSGPTDFHVVDGRMASTVDDIWTYARYLKATAIVIDGAYLLRSSNARLDRYQRVADNVDRIKHLATELEIPVICSWQFSREAAKKLKKKTGDNRPDLEDIGYSDAIPQHSSIVLGLMQSESVVTIKHRQITVLKGRGGQSGEFKVFWDFAGMNFAEDTGELEEDALKFL